MPLDRFRTALEEDHPFCLGMMVGMSQWVHHLVGLLEDVALRDATGRLARFLSTSRRTPTAWSSCPCSSVTWRAA